MSVESFKLIRLKVSDQNVYMVDSWPFWKFMVGCTVVRLTISGPIAESDRGSPTQLMNSGSKIVSLRPIFENFKHKQTVCHKSEPNVNHTQVIEQRCITN